MLTTVACSCVRNGSRVSVPVARLSLLSTVKSSTRRLNPTGLQDLSSLRSSRLLYFMPWPLQGRLSVCLSAAACRCTDPLSPLSPPTESDPPAHENFGSLSSDISSKRSFRKSSPYVEALLHPELDEDDGEKPHRKPGRRNTPYWYFLQCKKLIREKKVSRFEVFGL